MYIAWSHMLKRCGDPNDPGYKYYGGRGITVCDRWLKLENFVGDMGHPEDGMTLDRVDNNSGYRKDNCRWTTMAHQAHNMSSTKLCWADVNAIRSRLDSAATLARERGVSAASVLYVIQNKTWVDSNYIPPPKTSRGSSRTLLGHYIGPARTSDKQEPNHDL